MIFSSFVIDTTHSFLYTRTTFGRLAQLVRVLGLHPRCRGFESLIVHHEYLQYKYLQRQSILPDLRSHLFKSDFEESTVEYRVLKRTIKTKGKSTHRWYYSYIVPVTQKKFQRVCKDVYNQAEAYAFISTLPTN